MSVRVISTRIDVLDMRTRIPFKYGIATLTALPHMFVSVEVEIGGGRASGVASDGLPPKWFTKNPEQPFGDELREMIGTIRTACDFAVKAPAAPTPFDLWLGVYREQERWGAGRGYPALLWAFGVSLVERAVIDAFCRGTGVAFAQAVRRNTLGMRLGEHYGDLEGYAPGELLPEKPLRRIDVRHTVGLGDAITENWIAPDDRLDDGLPQSLDQCIGAYDLRYFKLKLSGHREGDMERLLWIADAIDVHARGDVAFTLDGNEQFRDVESFRSFWLAALERPILQRLMKGLLFVEQPFHREVALSDRIAGELSAWDERPPMIIDESDGELTSLATALRSGYVGTSHKNCKGVFKGIANACLIEHLRRSDPGGQYVISAEDLANVGPVALLQDLAVVATLGIEHAERNGHHYFAGLGMLPTDVQQAVLRDHGDLYAGGDFPTLRIDSGCIDLGSVVDAPFGVASEPDPDRFVPLDRWTPDALGDI